MAEIDKNRVKWFREQATDSQISAVLGHRDRMVEEIQRLSNFLNDNFKVKPELNKNVIDQAIEKMEEQKKELQELHASCEACCAETALEEVEE